MSKNFSEGRELSSETMGGNNRLKDNQGNGQVNIDVKDILSKNNTEDITEIITNSQDLCKDLTDTEEELRTLSQKILYYSEGMQDLLEDIQKGPKKSRVPKGISKTMRRVGRLKFIGPILVSTQKKLSEFDQSSMDELESGGLEQLKKDFDAYYASIPEQYRVMSEMRESLTEYIGQKQEAVTSGENLQDTTSLENDILLLNTQLQNIDTAIHMYKTSIIVMMEDIPKALQYIATGLVGYRISKTGNTVANTNQKLRQITESSVLIPFEMVGKTAEILQQVTQSPLLGDDFLEKQLLPLIQSNEATIKQIPSGKGSRTNSSSVLAQLAATQKQLPKE